MKRRRTLFASLCQTNFQSWRRKLQIIPTLAQVNLSHFKNIARDLLLLLSIKTKQQQLRRGERQKELANFRKKIKTYKRSIFPPMYFAHFVLF